MAEIVTIEQAKQAGINLRNKITEDNIKDLTDFRVLLEDIKNMDEESEVTGLNEIAAMIAIDDDQFAILEPVFFGELEKSYMDPNTQILLVKSMNAMGRTAEDVQEEYIAICDEIDSMTAQILSAPKRLFLKNVLGLTYNAVAQMDGIEHTTINVPIEYCHENAKMPTYAHVTDAGMDIYALEDITIGPGETKLIPTGIKVALPAGYELQVRPKSGRCLKTKLRIANAPGTIDAGYRDEIGVIIDNIDPPIRAIHPRTEILDQGTGYESVQLIPITEGDIEYGQSYTIGKGEKFAQLVLARVPKVCWIETESVANTGEDRGGGFGSTGLK